MDAEVLEGHPAKMRELERAERFSSWGERSLVIYAF
jgi:hypothetical protein